jgi:hypothetical protein
VKFEEMGDFAVNGILYREKCSEKKMQGKAKLLKILLLPDVTACRLVNI